MDKRVEIYNPNTLNPYAFEVAGAVRAVASLTDVTVTAPTSGSSWVPAGVVVKRTLSPGRHETQFVKHAWRRFFGPVRFALTAHRKSTVVVAWTRGRWDELVLGLRAWALGRTLTVVHNPPDVRGDRVSYRFTERFLLRHSTPVVHSDWLAERVAHEFRNVRVAEHPPYAEMARALSNGRYEPDQRPRPVFAFVGSLRPDKGAAALAELARISRSEWTLRFIGAGPVPPPLATELRKAGVDVVNTEGDFRPADDELATALSSCDAVLAPYSGVTTSGTMILAASLGLPVLALESSGARAADRGDLIVAESIAAMATEIERFQPRRTTITHAVDEWRREAGTTWYQLIKGAE